jgi:di/tricarboxylate transporter
MSWEAWYTLIVLAVVAIALMREWFPPSAVMLGGLVLVLVPGVVTPEQALSGFSNPAPFTIAALYVIAGAVQRTGILAPLGTRVFGGDGSPAASLWRITVPTTAASSVLNNTPIVAMLIPQVEAWARTRQQPVSRYLMPLSFAAILGGVVTLMGTATNIAVSGLLEEVGQEPLGFFEMTPVGLPIAVVCLLMLPFLAITLLPQRTSTTATYGSGLREFVVDMLVKPGSPADGQTVAAIGLRQLKGVYLIAVERGGETMSPVAPTTTVHGGDRLRFAGRVDDVLDLEAVPGLEPAESVDIAETGNAAIEYFEAVIGAASPLVGMTVREADFRSRYLAAVVAVHRSGRPIDAKIGDVPLRVGDTLLVLGDPGFAARWRDRVDFLLISPIRPAAPRTSPRAGIVGAVMVGIIAATASGLLPLVTAALAGVAVLVVTGIVSPTEARRSVDLDVIITIAAACALAQAMAVSGLATVLADGILAITEPIGVVAVLAALVVLTMVLKELITNKAAILLLVPIGFSIAAELGSDPRPFAIAIAVAGALSFLTPVGFPTNTMVYGPGGYRMSDYLRLGLPLSAIATVGIIAIVPIIWPL